MALRVSDRGVQRRMSEAFLLRERFPTTLKVWEDGGIDAAHAWAISRTGMLLRTPDDRARFEALALEAARTESPTRMTAAVKVIAATIDPDAFTDATDRAYEPGVPRGGGLSGPRRRDRDGVSHRAMVSENDQELTQKDDTARWLLTSLPSSSCSGN